MQTYNAVVNYVAADIAAASADYRRRARRIRANFSGNSLLTQHALGDLARRRNVETLCQNQAGSEVVRRTGSEYSQESGSSDHVGTGLDQSRRSTLQLEISTVVERGFSEHAASKLQTFGFTFSDRVALLDAAERLGISRFRANLILAMQENQTPARRSAAPGNPSRRLAPPLLLILGLEIAVVGVLVGICSF